MWKSLSDSEMHLKEIFSKAQSSIVLIVTVPLVRCDGSICICIFLTFLKIEETIHDLRILPNPKGIFKKMYTAFDTISWRTFLIPFRWLIWSNKRYSQEKVKQKDTNNLTLFQCTHWWCVIRGLRSSENAFKRVSLKTLWKLPHPSPTWNDVELLYKCGRTNRAKMTFK